MRSIITYIIICFTATSLVAQEPWKPNSSEIHQEIKKLNVLASVLYVAAHPDDENTSMIAYMANHVKAETAYISLTRGDGGQNLIGTEIASLLGVLRTEELLAARRIDGGEQYFSRANDFGFSKHPDETFAIWNKDQVLSDLVTRIRAFQPDIIINRFDHRSPGTTHGHHTGSAVLGVEAFDLAGSKNYAGSSLKPWQSERIFFNTSWWFYGSREKFAKADKTNLYNFDIGVYYPLHGKSNTEIAAESRSEHRCQGMGRLSSRGESIEYLELINGSSPSDKNNVFSGINTTWSRIDGGDVMTDLINQVDREFDASNPSKSVKALVNIYNKIESLGPSIWRDRKLEDCRRIIQACSGFFLDLTTSEPYAAAGAQIDFDIEMINRSDAKWKLVSYEYTDSNIDSTLNTFLENNQKHKISSSLLISDNLDYSSPYWLRKEGSLGTYQVDDQNLIGLPETPDPIIFDFKFEVEGTYIDLQKALVYKTSDPVKGELYDPFEVLPKVFVAPTEETIILKPNETRYVKVELTAGKDDIKGIVKPIIDKDWKIEPSEIPFELKKKNEKAIYEFTITSPNHQSVKDLNFQVSTEGQLFEDQLIKIAYDHIPTQYILQKNKLNTICIDLEFVGNRVGYIMGAGDKIPDALRSIGYQVDMIDESNIQQEKLNNFPAIIVGIRAYNTIQDMEFHHAKLMKYVEQGGTLIVQYNTSHRLKSKELGPYPFALSRKRVTNENAEVTILHPEHPIMNTPNKITAADFEGWVQERGLYFPETWDEKYTALLSSHDEGEEALEGGMLVAKYGRGNYIYTGYSFFRELPAGVPGAYRIFANMISLGQIDRP